MNPIHDTTAPQYLGPYRLIRVLGEGASGTVWLAEQQDPQRSVALKLLRLQGDDVRARFAREARLLAQLEHPGIARLYAADVIDTPAGPQPYLAMEYVAGDDVLQHGRTMSMRQQIALLAQICRAVHFAHTRGVIHRDLKPANILVDAHGAPKVLDFGVAHVIDADGETLRTRVGEVLGTLPYMSWEQLGGEAAALDPRSDVFALGVIGYELIAGSRPYPALPTSTLTAVLEQRRSTPPQRLSQRRAEARGDVETMLHKAMAFEASQRYGSADELAGDLQRYLDCRPIEARPMTATYVMGRFARRHRALTAAVLIGSASLAISAGVSLRYAAAERTARTQAEARAAELTAVNRLLEDTLSAASPESTTPAGQRSLLEVLEAGEQITISDRSLPPNVAAQALKTMGATWHGLEQYARARSSLSKARERLAHIESPQDDNVALLTLEVDALDALAQMAQGELDAGRQQLQQVMSQLPRASGAAQELRMAVYGRYADALLGRADYAGVIAELGSIVGESRETIGDRHVLTLFNEGRLAYAQRLSGDVAGAAQRLSRLLPLLRDQLGTEHPLTLLMLNEYGLGLLQSGQPEPANAIFAELVALDDKVYGANSHSSLNARGNRINALIELKRWDEATQLARVNYQTKRTLLGESHFDTLMASRSLARVLEKAGELVEAEALYRAAIDGIPRAVGAQHAEAFRARNDYGVYLIERGRIDDAVALYRALHTDSVTTFGDDNLNTAAFDNNWARALHAGRRCDEARTLLETTIPKLVRHYGDDNPRTQKARERLLDCTTTSGSRS